MITRRRLEIQANQNMDSLEARTVINETRRGRLNNGGEVTLTAGAASTTLNDDLITTNSAVFLQPKTSNAAAALGTTYFDAPTAGSIVIRHANAATTDRTFAYGVFF